MFSRSLLNDNPTLRSFGIATSVFPLVLIFGISALQMRRYGSLGRKGWGRMGPVAQAAPPGWVFGVVWATLCALWIPFVVLCSMEMKAEVLVAFLIFHLLTTLAATFWLVATPRWGGRVGGYVLAMTLVFALCALVTVLGGEWGVEKSEGKWFAATLWVPLLVWCTFATMLSVVGEGKQ